MAELIQAQAPLQRQSAALGYIAFAVLAALVVWPWFMGPYILHIAILTSLNILIVNGLSIIERSGQLSFGHSAFVAIGAYSSVLMATHFGMSPLLSGVLALILTAAIAFLLGGVILRLKGVYFVLVTFAFAELTRLVLLDWGGITGGASGIASIPAFELFGFSFDSRTRFYGLAIGLALLSVWLTYAIFRRPLGHAFTAVAQNAPLAESTGLSVYRLQLVAFIIGCMLAALGGVLMARYIGFISPESFSINISIGLITMLVIGGRGSLWGPLIGAAVLSPLPEFFREAVQTQHIFYGAALILILRFLPAGLVSLGRVFRAGDKGRQ